MTDSTTKKGAKENATKYIKVPTSLKNVIALEAKRLTALEHQTVTEGDIVRRAWDSLRTIARAGGKIPLSDIPGIFLMGTGSTIVHLPDIGPADIALPKSSGVVRSWFEVLQSALEEPDSSIAKQLLLVSLKATRELLGEQEASGDAQTGSPEETERQRAEDAAAAELGRDVVEESQRDHPGDGKDRKDVG